MVLKETNLKNKQRLSESNPLTFWNPKLLHDKYSATALNRPDRLYTMQQKNKYFKEITVHCGLSEYIFIRIAEASKYPGALYK